MSNAAFDHVSTSFKKTDDALFYRVFYIIGNLSFYGVTVPSERIYVDMMHEVGFTNAEYRIVRKRNCSKQLYEFVVSAQKP